MQGLTLQTEHLAHHSHDFSVLPSPSTFFSSSSHAPSSTDTPAFTPSVASFDYGAALSAALESTYGQAGAHSVASSTPEPAPAWSASESDGASSPASSLQPTPKGSPMLDQALLAHPGLRTFESGAAMAQIKREDPGSTLAPLDALDGAMGFGFADAQHSEPLLGLEARRRADALGSPLAPAVRTGTRTDGVHGHPMYAFAPAQGFHAAAPSLHGHANLGAQHSSPASHQLPSPAPSAGSLPGGQQHQQQYYAEYQFQQQCQANLSAAAATFAQGQQFAAAPPLSLDLQQQQQGGQFVPVQFTTINGATYAVAVPVSQPQPAAIETPHGTYYFVPNPAQPIIGPVSTSAPAPVEHSQSQPQPQIVAPVPVAAASAAPVPAAPQVLEAVAEQSDPPADAALVLPTGATVPASALPSMTAQQKIRLPVGQGKRGSTKRAPKKDQAKRFFCPHPGCGRPFTRNYNMQSHYKSHLGIREFTCPHCPKKFSRRHDRARHCAAVHDVHVDRDGNLPGCSTASHSGASSAGAGSPRAADEFDDVDDDDDDELAPAFDLGFDVTGSG
ncbi:hypothetical protein Rhopal_006082-T1 [Rhodotorula paludigena]|uniref:C2H2-type domain-containing protein n=1 Tax=Rhodotorula paludigena TaxID=86838 RepID=A0AAV5GVG7_9BASI|nr:hypothetical protein Rhopal_006082-T1 [Rhodotorula paludigena]